MRCLSCQYDLRNLCENRCPECGRAFDPNDPNTFQTSTLSARDRELRQGVIWLVCIALGSFIVPLGVSAGFGDPCSVGDAALTAAICTAIALPVLASRVVLRISKVPRPSIPLWAIVLSLIVLDVAELGLWLRQWRLADYDTSLAFGMYVVLPIFVAQITLCAVGFSRSGGSVRKFFMYHGIIAALIFACADLGLLAP